MKGGAYSKTQGGDQADGHPSETFKETAMQHVYQCPRCELRFGLPTELRDHLDLDHPHFEVVAGSIEDDLLAACHCHHHHRHPSVA